MIVTCPGCSSKYRVRNEMVPGDGARMRCPKCETLFLAKPPPDGTPTMDDPSSMYQQLAPHRPTGTTGPVAPVPAPTAPGGPPKAPGVGAPQAGPITSLFAAVDPSMLPPEAQRPPQPPPQQPSAPSPSGLTIDDSPKVRTVNVAPNPALRDATVATSAMRPARGSEPERRLLPIVALAAGAVCFVVGTVTWAWATETLPLDSALMPIARSVLSARGPGDVDGPDADAVRRGAVEAGDRKDLPAAVILWRRAKALEPEDRRAGEALAKILVELGEVP